MSKLIDKLKRVSLAVPQPMGFRTMPIQKKPKILLLASLTQPADINGLVDYAAGADAGLLHISNLTSGVKALQKMSRIMPDIPWGGWLKDANQPRSKQMVKADCDFLVFPAANTSLAILQNDKLGRILEVEASVSEGLLRTVNDLPVDAVLLAGVQEEDNLLTWRHLMLFQHFANLLAKPLLVAIPPNVTASELQTLWEVGVDGVIVEVETGQPTERLKELRQTIDRLTFPSPRKPKKVEALLPHISWGGDMVTEEEEE